MKLERDPEVVSKLARQREDENWRFRLFLKGIDLEIEELDAIVHRHYDEVACQIDCCACGNCCREILPALTDADVDRLASGLGTCDEDVVGQYLARAENGDLTFRGPPCPFLEGNLCRVYEHRPEVCRSYPHLHKDEFVFRLIQTVLNYSICPIVFNVYERLKRDLWR